MIRNSTALLAPSTRRLAAVAAAASSTTAVSATATRRPANLAPTWFANSKPADCSSNLKFIAISMRHVEIKSSDVVARASDSLSAQQKFANSFSSSCADPAPAPAPAQCEYDGLRTDESNNNVVFLSNVVTNSETDITFGDPSGGESLSTAPVQFNHRGKGQWGKPFFGKVFHQPRNFAYQTSTYWSKKFRMKKHRYTKRWQKRRYKVAALANLPFAKKLRVNMIPKLLQGKKKTVEAGSLDLDFSPDAQDAAAAAATGKMKSGTKKRFRPKSKYQV